MESKVKSCSYTGNNLRQEQEQDQDQDQERNHGPFLGLAQSRMIPRNICRANTRHLNPSNIIPISPAHGTDIIDD